MLADQDLPRCPNCGGPTFFNIRCAHWFVEEPWEKGQRNWEHWLAQNRTNNIVAIDIGSGFNTPMWVRWPLEQITTLQPGNTLIRLNRDHPDVPAQIKAQSICFQEDYLDPDQADSTPALIIKQLQHGKPLSRTNIHAHTSQARPILKQRNGRSTRLLSACDKTATPVSILAESIAITVLCKMRPVLEGSGRDADPCQR